MIDVAGSRKHDARRGVVLVAVGENGAGAVSFDTRRLAEDRAAERMTRKSSFAEQLEHQIVGGIVGGGDFLQDYILLFVQFRGIEDGIRQDVGKNIECEGPIVLEHAREIGRRLHAGGGVDLSADVLDFRSDIHGTAAGSALERHMLEQVSNTPLLGRFITRARLDPDAERQRFEMRHMIGKDMDAVGEAGNADGHAFIRKRIFCFTASMSLGKVSKCSGRCMRDCRDGGKAG
jgi:hypothetical protein